jgi:hypothetical protein
MSCFTSEDQERRIYVSRVHCAAGLASCVAWRPSSEPSKRINWMTSCTQESTSYRQGSTLRKQDSTSEKQDSTLEIQDPTSEIQDPTSDNQAKTLDNQDSTSPG